MSEPARKREADGSDSDIQQAWNDETRARLARLDAGEARVVDATEVLEFMQRLIDQAAHKHLES